MGTNISKVRILDRIVCLNPGFIKGIALSPSVEVFRKLIAESEKQLASHP
jgi:hypothetical protein